MNTNHDTISGFESDNFENLAQDAFAESLNTAIGTDVEICNYDLSQRKPQRVIVEGCVQDTRLNALQRKILAPIGTCKAGEYVFYKNRYWLIIGLVDDNKVYEKGVMILCNYLLSWLNKSGKPIQRWVSASSASQYNNGETSDNKLVYRSDQLMVLTPQDDECLLMPHGQRFIIDLRTKVYEKMFTDETKISTSNPLITYELTRMDGVLFNYNDSGHSEFMAYEDEKHENDGYYVIDGKGYWLCDIPIIDKESTSLACEIECDEPILYNGIEPTIFTAKFNDMTGNPTTAVPQWSIECPFKDDLTINYVDNSILIFVDNDKHMNKSFELSLSADGYKSNSITVTIKAFM